MWDLDDSSTYINFLDVTIPNAFTWGSKDLEKREMICAAVTEHMPKEKPAASRWAFRLYAKKGGGHGFDVENIPKIIVDSFSGNILRKDNSKYLELELYSDDKVDCVAMVQIAGEAYFGGDSTRIEIFTLVK